MLSSVSTRCTRAIPLSVGVLLMCCLAGAVAGKAQQPPVETPRPTFRSSTDLVQIDVSVLDKKRLPVRGLTAADFTVFADGHARPVETFAEIDLPDRVTSAEPTWSRDIAPDVATNQVAEDEGRLVIILMDRTIPLGLPATTARRIATAVVDSLGKGDVAALVSSSGGMAQNFTSDRSRLLRAIGQKDWSTGTSAEVREIEESLADGLLPPGLFTRLTDPRCLCGLCTLNTVTGVAEALQDVTRRRKSLVFIGTDLTVQAGPEQQAQSELGCGLKLKDAREKMFTALQRSGVTVHSVDPSGLNLVGPTTQASSTIRGRQAGTIQERAVNEFIASQNNLRMLPETTGGRTVTNTNAPESRVPDIMRESQSYYLLGFRPTGDEGISGQFHALKVVVNRPDVNVHSRTGYTTPDTAAASSSPDDAPALRASITSALPDGSVAVDLNAGVFATSGSDPALVTLATGVTGFASPGDSTSLEIVAAAFDPAGQLKASGRQVLQLAWPRGGNGSAQRVDALSRLELAPGDYELRVGVSGGDSRHTASVFTYLTVPRFDQLPLSLSSVVLGAMPGTSSVPADFLAMQLPIVPTAQRTFSRSQNAVGFMRIYQGTGRAEPIQPVTVRARVLDTNGQPAIEHAFVLAPEQFAVGRTGECRITLPLSRLAPGDYVLAVDVAMGERTAGRAVRFRVAS